jgi:hypothetical protein
MRSFANAFLSPSVNSRAELAPSPRAYARNGAVGSGKTVSPVNRHIFQKIFLGRSRLNNLKS